MKTSIGLIVGGVTEQRGLARWVPRKNIRISTAFGGDATPSGMAKSIATLARTLSPRCRQVVVVLDREYRTISARQLSEDVAAAIKNLVSVPTVEIVTADTMVENWMLADVDGIRQKKYISSNAKQKKYEGTKGCSKLQAIMEKGYTYGKTTHGVELLEIIRPDVARRNSASFALFANSAGI